MVLPKRGTFRILRYDAYISRYGGSHVGGRVGYAYLRSAQSCVAVEPGKELTATMEAISGNGTPAIIEVAYEDRNLGCANCCSLFHLSTDCQINKLLRIVIT